MPLRDMTEAMREAFTSSHIQACLLFQLEVADGTIYLWTGQYPVLWDGKLWTGAGLLLGFSGVTETLATQANGWSVTLSGLSPEVAAVALGYIRQGKLGHVWLGALNEGQLIADPLKIASGRADVPTIVDGDTSSISLSFESVFIDLRTLREFRWTDQSHRLLYPNDPSFEFVTSIQTKDWLWGRK